MAKGGIVRVYYGGTITRGDRLVINGSTGSVKSAEALVVASPGTPSVQNVVGMAEICEHSRGHRADDDAAVRQYHHQLGREVFWSVFGLTLPTGEAGSVGRSRG